MGGGSDLRNRLSELQAGPQGALHSELGVNVTFFLRGLHAVFQGRLKQPCFLGTEHGGDLVVDPQLFEATADVKAHGTFGKAQDGGNVCGSFAHG